MHEVGAYEAREGKKARHFALCLMGDFQQQISDECDRDLHANGVLADAEEAPDLEMLFDPAEEQLDAPARFVETGDFVCAGIEIVGEKAQRFAGLDRDFNFSERDRLEWMAPPACRLQAAIDPDVPVGFDRAPWCNRKLFHDARTRMRFEARHEPATGRIEL